MRALALAIVVVAAAAGAAHAHQSSITYATAHVKGREVSYTVNIDPGDLAEPIGRPPSAKVDIDKMTVDEWDRLYDYVFARIDVGGGDPRCAARGGVSGPHLGKAFVSWTVVCPAPIARLVIDYRLFFDLDPAHDGALRVTTTAGAHADTIFVADARRFVWQLTEPPPSGAPAFIRAGVHHVATGLDHVAFVLALLLALVLVRTPDGWGRPPIGAALRSTAGVVSAFTVAHSLTLIAAALGWVSLPARLVESLIAASIVFAAVEDIVRPAVRWRFAVAFGFGLMHGLGFARMLTPLLPPGAAVVPLLCFNVGVELAQLAIVAVALPAAWLLARLIGARRYREIALPILAGALAVVGAIWLIERALDIAIIPG